jgi:hypothetical protein
MEAALLDLIDGASASIDAAIYSLTRQSVIDAFLAAHNRGVTVRVVGDDETAKRSSRVGYQALVDGGITVVTDTVTNTLHHNKFMVFDEGVMWTGSTNFTHRGLTLNAIVTGTNPVTLTILDDDAYHPSITVSNLALTSGQAITMSVDQHPPQLSPYELLWAAADGAVIDVVSSTLQVDACGSRRSISFAVPGDDWGTRFVETRKADARVARSAPLQVAPPHRIYLPLVTRNELRE